VPDDRACSATLHGYTHTTDTLSSLLHYREMQPRVSNSARGVQHLAFPLSQLGCSINRPDGGKTAAAKVPIMQKTTNTEILPRLSSWVSSSAGYSLNGNTRFSRDLQGLLLLQCLWWTHDACLSSLDSYHKASACCCLCLQGAEPDFFISWLETKLNYSLVHWLVFFGFLGFNSDVELLTILQLSLTIYFDATQHNI